MWPACSTDPQGIALIQGAKDYPHDTLRRLILADWLEEQGELEVANCLRKTLHSVKARGLIPGVKPAARWAPWNGFIGGWPAIRATVEDLPNSPWFCALEVGTHPPRGGDGLATALAFCPRTKNLVVLVMRDNLISADGAEALAESPNLASLVHLDLSDNDIPSAGAEALAQSPHLARLATLDLASNRIGSSGAEALANSPHLANLTSLCLWLNGIGPAGAIALAYSPNLTNLTRLSLGGNDIGDAGAIALAQSPHLANLTSLYLDGNQIGDAGAQALEALRSRGVRVEF
jgi:uncharacterized protein (TIGR02996 family)